MAQELIADFGVECANRQRASRHDLGDQTIIFRAPLEPALFEMWHEHSETLQRGVDVGKALGYICPQDDAQIYRVQHENQWLWHLASWPGSGAKILLWSEYLGSDRQPAGLDAYVAKIRDELALGGLEHLAIRCSHEVSP